MVAAVDAHALARALPAVEVLEEPTRVAAALAPLRRELLRELKEPDSASGLARRLGISRQKLNYHLRELEKQGLVELVDLRQRRGCTERLLRTAARAFVVTPDVLGEIPAEPDEVQDQFSSAYLLSSAGRLMSDVATLRQAARDEGKRLATVTQETEIRFGSPRELKAFTEELAAAVAALAAKYNRAESDTSRAHKVFVGVHPVGQTGKDD